MENQRVSSIGSNWNVFQSTILEEYKKLEDIMTQVYEEMTTLPKLVAPLLDIQKDLQERLKILKLTHMDIDSIQHTCRVS